MAITLKDILAMMAGQMHALSKTHGEQQAKKANGYKYTSFYHYVHEKGRAFESVALTTSEWSIVREFVVHTTPKECFFNSQRILFGDGLTAAADSPFEYVEGYVLAGFGIPLPVHHGWLSLNGKVVDPTLLVRSLFKRKTFPNRMMGFFPKEQEYYGVTLPWEKVLECILANEAWHSVIDDYKRDFPLLKEEYDRTRPSDDDHQGS